MTLAPYVIGQWVRGEKFYGRRSLIEEIIAGPRDSVWLLGSRRSGKTSVLRQAELLTTNAEQQIYFPLYWDLQGSETLDELEAGFADALIDAEERVEAQDVPPGDVWRDDLFATLRNLRRLLRGRGRRLLLLCDEAEVLVSLHRHEPTLLRKLRKALQGGDGVRSVLASTLQLWEVADQREDTSPFLHGFLPPLYLRNLDPDESRALIRQSNSPADSRPPYDPETVESIRRRCDDHPYLLQLVCRRLLDTGDVEQAAEEVAADPMVSQFFATDFAMLSHTERRIIKLIGRRKASTSNTIQQAFAIADDHLRGLLHRLDSLGYIRRTASHDYELVNFFFRRWFAEKPGSDSSSSWIPSARSPDARSDATASPSTSWSVPPLPVASGAALASELRELLFTGDQEADYPPLGPFDGRYELLELVGEGGTGAVFRARDQLLQTAVAVKVLRPAVAADPAALERFRREIALCREIVHPNLLRLYHLGEGGGRIYLTMRWIDGGSLAETLRREGSMPAERVQRMFSKLAGALAALHSRGVLHRDVKPANVLVDGATDEPYLCDFGLARLKDVPGVTQSGVFVGTPAYAAPEQIRVGPVDERADLYALGRIVLQLLDESAIRSHPGRIARRCTETDPEDRPRNAEQLVALLA